MSRRIYIIAKTTVIDATVRAAAEAENCPEIVKGIPPRLTGIISPAILPVAYQEPVIPPYQKATANWAKVTAFNPVAEKPLEVERTYNGNVFTLDCYVSQAVKDQYIGGQIVIGDYVLVEFVDGKKDQPLAVTKIYKTW